MTRLIFPTIICFAIFISSCGNQDKAYVQSESYEINQFDQTGYNSQDAQIQQTHQTNQQNQQNTPKFASKGETVNVADRNTGITMWSIDLPAGWTWNHTLDYSKSPQFPSVDWRANHQTGAIMHNVRSEVYQYSNDPQMVQMMRAGQMVVRPVENAQSVQQNQIRQMMGNNGYQLKGQPKSEPAHLNRLYSSVKQMGLDNVQLTCLTSDWVNANGQKARTLLYHATMDNVTSVGWFYETIIIEGKGKQFKSVAAQMEKATMNIRHSSQWASHYRQVMTQMAQQSQADHQQRMINNQRNFEAQQRAFNQSNTAINNSINSTYQTNSQAQDANHNAFIDYIRDEQNVYDPSSGNTYKVESGYDNYYKTDDGDIYGTNDY